MKMQNNQGDHRPIEANSFYISHEGLSPLYLKPTGNGEVRVTKDTKLTNAINELKEAYYSGADKFYLDINTMEVTVNRTLKGENEPRGRETNYKYECDFNAESGHVFL